MDQESVAAKKKFRECKGCERGGCRDEVSKTAVDKN